MIPVTHPAHEGPPPLGALLFRPGPGLAPEAHRVARALMEDAARNRGGRVSPEEGGTWRLVAAPPALDMARRTLSAVLHGRDAALVTEALASPAPEKPENSGPEALLRALPVESLLERRAILGFGPGGMPRPAGWRVLPSRKAIASALGKAWEGEPWQAHGWAVVARRAAERAAPEDAPLHLDLLPEALATTAPNLLPVLPPRALARPPAMPFAVDGPGLAALEMIDPANLPGLALHLAHDPALEALPADFWRALGPARVVLEGVADRAALEWGLAQGFARFTGPQADRLLAALRQRPR
ncbi:hypothetical protein SAMN02745194_03543 [Roseomonas rosea]|uniref:Uncharacterized protein n=1 Tax=Muricoccus roseus TaxID=198092 RepID=A0A1M6MNE1_9PROT|nr:hypothetical protein [Roseomonas rosea]SHJ84972.1 hypothetical protein SAMN02745194_03543 [Roseomonas rosea]